MRSLTAFLALCSIAVASVVPSPSNLHKRDGVQICTDLRVSGNNGDRKVAVVIDSSGSMLSNDPHNLRISAGRALNEFLISNDDSKSVGKNPDQISVIDFDSSATLDYPLGDPGAANASFSKIGSGGGTNIASGVVMALDQLVNSTGATDKRSAIVVFTDGEDSSTDKLVYAINNATAKGIRVSFGFLDVSAANQNAKILKAIRDSRGVYATITLAAGSQNFINYVLLNGLTYNDNPQGYDSQLLSGLSETHLISGSSTITLKYAAEQGERVNFTVTTISAGTLSATPQMNGQTLQSAVSVPRSAQITVTAPSTGEMQLLITAQNAAADSLFSVSTNSNVPIKNCTVGVGDNGQGGLSSGAKAGIGIGVTAAVLGLLGTGGWFAYKHFFAGGGGGGGGGAGGGLSGPPGDGGISQAPGAEKLMPHVNVAPVDPASTALSPSTGLEGTTTSPMSGMEGTTSPMSGMEGTTSPMSGMEGTTSPMSGMEGTMQSPMSGGPGAQMPMGLHPTGAEGGGLSGPPGGLEGGLQSGVDPSGPLGPGPGGPSAPGIPPPMSGPGAFMPIVPIMVPLSPGSPNSQSTSPRSQTPLIPQYGYAPPPQQVMYGAPPNQPMYPHTASPHAQYPYQPNLPGSGPAPPQELMAPGTTVSPQSTGPVMSPHSTGNTFSPQSTGGSYPNSTAPGGLGELPGHGDLAPLSGQGDLGPPPPGAELPGSGSAPHQGFAHPVGPVLVMGSGRERRHHHHPWLARGVACEDGGCPYNMPGHVCAEGGRCECVCWDGECPLNR